MMNLSSTANLNRVCLSIGLILTSLQIFRSVYDVSFVAGPNEVTPSASSPLRPRTLPPLEPLQNDTKTPDSAAGTMYAQTLSRPLQKNQSAGVYNPPVVDILSIGSNHRVFYLNAQRRTFATHVAVRYFVSVTEEDDIEQECHTLKRRDAQAIVEYCRVPPQQKVVPGSERSVLDQRRKDYHEWKSFARKKPNQIGWIDGLGCMPSRENDTKSQANKDTNQYGTKGLPTIALTDAMASNWSVVRGGSIFPTHKRFCFTATHSTTDLLQRQSQR